METMETGVMQTETRKKLFTVDEYHRMAEAGILQPKERIELIHGEIVHMSPIGPRHVACADRAAALFVPPLVGRAIVSIQGAVELNVRTEPQPDVLILKPASDFYASRRRNPGDVLLLVEVSDTSLRYDTRVKRPIYAAAGILEFWIEDLRHDRLLVHRDPDQDIYKTSLTLGPDDSVSPLAFPDLVVRVRDLLGERPAGAP